MNDTIRKFGYPQTLLAEYEHWMVLLRPEQPVLGALVLAAKSEATALSDLPVAAFTELAQVTAAIERALDATVAKQKMNYLMLMLVDRHVHCHALPRYEGTRSHAGLTIADAGWPKAAALDKAVTLDAAQIAALVAWLKPALA